MEQDYRLYLEEKFKGLMVKMDAEFEMLNTKLESIEKQTIKTNGRVNKLEDKNEVHLINCPNTGKIKIMDDELIEYRILKKYPKISIILLTFSIIMFILSIFEIIK